MPNINTTLQILITLFFGVVLGMIFTLIAYRKELRSQKKISLKFQRSVLGGKFAEHLAPYLPGFPNDLKPSEARFMGDPIDFIVYKGADEKKISEVVFVEVKTGQSQLNENERSLRDVINEKKVRWVSYRVPEAVTKIESAE